MSKVEKRAQDLAAPADRAQQVKAVIERMESGESERSACNSVGINRATFRSAALKVGAVDHYARACEAIAQDQVESLEAAIADMRNGVIDAGMARVEIDARKWVASKLLPRRYGDKMEVDMTTNLPDVAKATSTLDQILGLLANK